MQKNQLYKRVGCAEQVLGIRDYTFHGGKADGLRAMELYNETGMSLTVLPGRGMDIANLSCKGVNLSFLSKTGITHSTYFTEDKNRGFFRSFFAGFLTTCGLSYMGASCRDREEELGLHGVISNTPAYEVCPETAWNGENAALRVSGKVKQAQVFGEHLVLHRTVELSGQKNCFTIEDRIENLDFAPAPFMLLYHMNFGYPLLSPHCELKLPSEHVVPRDREATSGLADLYKMTDPVDGFQEQVFFHQMMPFSDGKVHVLLINRKLPMAVELIYRPEDLPNFTQWRCMKSGEYVLGLEPGNCHVLGRAQAREDKTLPFLAPGEEKVIRLEVCVYSSLKEISAASAAFDGKQREVLL